MTLSASIVLQDRISSAMQRITNALNVTIEAFEAMNAASLNPIDTASLSGARISLAEVGAEAARVERELGQAGAAIGEAGERAANAESGFSRVAKAIGLVTLASKTAGVMAKGIDYASDLQEVQNVVDVTFQNSSDRIDQWAKGAIDAYGMNEVSAKRYAGTVGAMLKSSGLASDAAVGMSQDMVGLAGDMASFYNLDIETAFEKIRAGVSGETEPLKQLGINMSVANLEAYALSQGISESYSSMSQAEQVMLRYNYLMNATADAQGDFARTSDSWANQTRMLSENWLGFTGVLAEQLLPVLTLAADGLNKVVGFLTDNADTVSAALLGISVVIGILTAAWAVNTVVTWLQVAANRALMASMLTNPILWIAIAIGVVIAVIYKWVQSVGGLRIAWLICVDKVMTAWETVQLGFQKGVNKVLNFWDSLKIGIKQAATAVQNTFGDMKVRVLTTLQDMINEGIGLINWFIEKANGTGLVSFDLLEQVTFGTTAEAENAAEKAARQAEFEEYVSDAQNRIIERKAKEDEDARAIKDARDGRKLTIQTNIEANQNMEQPDISPTPLPPDIPEFPDPATNLANQMAGGLAAPSMAEDISRIKDNTSTLVDEGVELSEDDAELLRASASQSFWNSVSSREYKIEVINHNNIASDLDADGIISKAMSGLTEKFIEAMETEPEGVHV